MTSEEKHRFTLRITDDMAEKLKNEAVLKGVSVNALIVQILWEWLEKQNNKEQK